MLICTYIVVNNFKILLFFTNFFFANHSKHPLILWLNCCFWIFPIQVYLNICFESFNNNNNNKYKFILLAFKSYFVCDHLFQMLYTGWLVLHVAYMNCLHVAHDSWHVTSLILRRTFLHKYNAIVDMQYNIWHYDTSVITISMRDLSHVTIKCKSLIFFFVFQ